MQSQSFSPPRHHTGWEQDILTCLPNYFGFTRASLGRPQQELPLIRGPGRALSRARHLSQPTSHHATHSKHGAHQQLPEQLAKEASKQPPS